MRPSGREQMPMGDIGNRNDGDALGSGTDACRV